MSLWYENAVFYSIYPLGFCGAEKFNDGGEVRYRFDKIIEWIPHLKKMNVGAVYLGPVFESVEHGYDTIDYKTIDRRLGDNNSFRHICEELHKNDIRIVVDGVFNHVGRKFPQFVDVQRNGQNSGYCGWFQNLNFGGKSPCGDDFWYEGWNGHYNLVKLNMKNIGVCDHIIDAVNYWIEEFKIDGIRLDAADCIDFEFFKRLRNFCKSKRPDFWLMGEIIHGDYNRWANPEMLDSTTNYECYKGIYSSHNDKNYFEIDYSINRQFGSNGGIYKNIKLFTFVDNHDVNRLASTLRNPEHLRNCYTLMYTMPGIPSIYYGSEYGITGIHENNSDDGLRPCLDINELEKTGNKSLFEHIVKLGRIYEAYPPLRTGSYQTIIVRNQQLLFKKELNGQIVYVALNLEDKDYDLNFGTHLPALVDVFSGQSLNINNGNAYIKMPPYSSMIIVTDDIINCSENETETEETAVVPEEVLVNRNYKDSKGNVYTVIAIARDSETLEELVIYKSLSESNEIWAKPKSVFISDSEFKITD